MITWLVYAQGYKDRAQQEHQDLIGNINSVRDIDDRSDRQDRFFHWRVAGSFFARRQVGEVKTEAR